MQNEIDLKKYNIRTDLAIDCLNKVKNEDIKTIVREENSIKVTKVKIEKDIEEINKKKGNYITIEFEDVTDYHNQKNIEKVLKEELSELLKLKKIENNDECLIIGLGNYKSTPDSLGPLTLNNILVTRHLFELKTDVKEGIRKVSKLTPGVMGETGIETSDIINNITSIVKPKFIIVIDALSSNSIERLNKTIQITDSGIQPGSGVGNKRKEISEKTLKIPVIAIGVPTVVDNVTIVSDSINYLFKYISYIKNNINKHKLEITHKNNQDILNINEKKELVGMIGGLDEEIRKKLILEVLMTSNNNFIVTPKEIDFLIEKLSTIISTSLNNALHKEVNHY